MKSFLMQLVYPWGLVALVLALLVLMLLEVALLLHPGSSSSSVGVADCPPGMVGTWLDARGAVLGCAPSPEDPAHPAPPTPFLPINDDTTCPPGMELRRLDERVDLLICAPMAPLLPTKREEPRDGPDGS